MAKTSEPIDFPELESLGLSQEDKLLLVRELRTAIPEADFGADKAVAVARSIRLSEKLDIRPSEVGVDRGWLRQSLRGWVGYAVAAAILAVVTWRILPTTSKPTSYTSTTYTTRSGQHASITLSDGSQATLGPATTLRVSREYSSQQAIAVEVTGEVLFKVNHAANRPFTVTAHGLATRVLGTEFVVRAYDPSDIRVAVREGRVSVQSPVSTPGNAAVVAAGEAALVAQNTLPVVSPISDLAVDFSWADGELTLKNLPLGEALVRLSRWYGMNFQVSDSSLLSSRVTSNFPAAFNEEEIRGLARIIGAQVKRSGNTITLSEAK